MAPLALYIDQSWNLSPGNLSLLAILLGFLVLGERLGWEVFPWSLKLIVVSKEVFECAISPWVKFPEKEDVIFVFLRIFSKKSKEKQKIKNSIM